MFIVASIYSPPLCDIFGVSALLSTQSESRICGCHITFHCSFLSANIFNNARSRFLKIKALPFQFKNQILRVQHCQFRNQISGFSIANSRIQILGHENTSFDAENHAMKLILFLEIYSQKGTSMIISSSISRRKQELDSKIRARAMQINKLPEGELVCYRNGRHFKWYVKKATSGKKKKTSLTYIPRAQVDLARTLAKKKVLEWDIEAMQHEIEKLNAFEDVFCISDQDLAHRILDSEEIRELVTPSMFAFSDVGARWMNGPFERNSQNPESLKYQILTGSMVRSKSEAIIANILILRHIPFRYEMALKNGNQVYYPDFTILDEATQKLYYLEHFGMMDDEKYLSRARIKISDYLAFGLVPGVNFIMSFESKDYPLDSELLNLTLDHYLGIH